MSTPLFPEPEPGESPSQRGTPEGQHPWAPSILDEYTNPEAEGDEQAPLPVE